MPNFSQENVRLSKNLFNYFFLASFLPLSIIVEKIRYQEKYYYFFILILYISYPSNPRRCFFSNDEEFVKLFLP